MPEALPNGDQVVETPFVDDSLSPAVRGFLYRPPANREPRQAEGAEDVLVLTHGAGSNSKAPLLVAVARAFALNGTAVLCCDLPFRQRRPHGPPFGTASEDRDGLRNALAAAKGLAAHHPVRGVFLGGHSYGGRQASMLAASEADLVDGLLLLSYPLHPPNRPSELRTAHFSQLRVPALFVHGSSDPFGSLEEIEAARKLIPGATSLLAIDGAGHDLGFRRGSRGPAVELPGRIASRFFDFMTSEAAHKTRG